jgi:hypothetical protein
VEHRDGMGIGIGGKYTNHAEHIQSEAEIDD